MNTDAAVVEQIQRASRRLNADCPECSLAELCRDNPDIEPDLLNIRRGQWIFRRGDQDRYLYSVRRGAAKLTRHRVVGEEQVLGFYFAGDAFGFDGLAGPQRINEAVALEDSTLCRVPLIDLTAGKHSTLSLHQTLSMFGNAALGFQEHAALVNQRQASTRLAAFVLDIANRSGESEGNTIRLSLPMSRQDIGSYLGLSVETVSRRLCDLERDGFISIDEKRTSLRILELERLQQIAHF